MTVKEILIEWLKAHGFTALCGDECGCSIDDLMPCEEICIHGCEPGYAIPCSACGECESYDPDCPPKECYTVDEPTIGLSVDYDKTGYREEALDRFKDEMLKKLVANQSKGTWDGLSLRHLHKLLMLEVLELDDAIKDNEGADAIRAECADVANYAMMIADNAKE